MHFISIISFDLGVIDSPQDSRHRALSSFCACATPPTKRRSPFPLSMAPGLAMWLALTNRLRWKWHCVSSRSNSKESWQLPLPLWESRESHSEKAQARSLDNKTPHEERGRWEEHWGALRVSEALSYLPAESCGKLKAAMRVAPADAMWSKELPSWAFPQFLRDYRT